MSMKSVTQQSIVPFIALLVILTAAVYLNLLVISFEGESISPLHLVILVFPAIYIADFVSGIFHFFVDYTPHKRGVGLDKLYFYQGDKGSNDYMLLRKAVMKKAGIWQYASFFFKHHHLVSPQHIAQKPAFTTFLPTLPLSIMLLVLSSLLAQIDGVNILIPLMLTLSGFFVFWAQYFHSLTHGRKMPFFLVPLQRFKFILSKEHHSLHHKYPTRYFCFVNGWADPLVNVCVNILLKGKLFDVEAIQPPIVES